MERCLFIAMMPFCLTSCSGDDSNESDSGEAPQNECRNKGQ